MDTANNNDDIINETGDDVNSGYKILEVVDKDVKTGIEIVTYDILCDGRLIWSTLTKPLAFAFLAGARADHTPKEDKGEGKGEDKGEGKGKIVKTSAVKPEGEGGNEDSSTGSQSGGKTARPRRML